LPDLLTFALTLGKVADVLIFQEAACNAVEASELENQPTPQQQ
jgi:hypothetical protein